MVTHLPEELLQHILEHLALPCASEVVQALSYKHKDPNVKNTRESIRASLQTLLNASLACKTLRRLALPVLDGAYTIHQLRNVRPRSTACFMYGLVFLSI